MEAYVPGYRYGGGGHGYGWRDVWSVVASLLFLWSMVRRHIPFQVEDHIDELARAVFARVTPYVTVTVDENAADTFGRSEAYSAADAYLSAARARRLRAELPDGSDRVSLAIGDNEEVIDDFRGATMWWRKAKATTYGGGYPWNTREEERRAYHLTFHRRHRALVEAAYLPHVLAEGRAVTVRNCQRRLFTNKTGGGEDVWNHVKLEHPATFDTLAMDPAEKAAIIDDLEMFRDGREYYSSVGRAWKRVYLLFGPPDTGKSSMIAAMANFLDYDVYDLELTAVKSNTELRRLFVETTVKSIIVIEDIDCSIDLTGKRKHRKNTKTTRPLPPMWPGGGEEERSEQVTLSGLLNFIDGLWSACGGERIIVFTTNHAERLDPALVRRGRMDMRIAMTYCRFQAFKVLARNYLHIAEHEQFGDIRRLLEEVDMTPAENLMPRSKKRDVDACVAKLVAALNKEALHGNNKLKEERTADHEHGKDDDGNDIASSDHDEPCEED